MFVSSLNSIINSIINSSDASSSQHFVEQLSQLFSQFQRTQAQELQTFTNVEVQVNGGIALSSYDAAICLDEPIRTAQFLKGTYEAITVLLQRFPDEVVHVLYAGCGPFGTLLLPLLPLLPSHRLQITLLDVNEYSLESVKRLHSYFPDFTIHTVKADATRYVYPQSKLHLVITETMYRALTREPQVSVTAQLAPQLCEGGILIPQNIDVELYCTDMGKEPVYRQDSTSSKVELPERLFLGKIFSLNKEFNFSSCVKNNPAHFISDWFSIPTDYKSYPDLAIFLSICVFGANSMPYTTSSINNPLGVGSLYNFEEESQFRLVYIIDNNPRWQYEKR